jgi:hypothetical protein
LIQHARVHEFADRAPKPRFGPYASMVERIFYFNTIINDEASN